MAGRRRNDEPVDREPLLVLQIGECPSEIGGGAGQPKLDAIDPVQRLAHRLGMLVDSRGAHLFAQGVNVRESGDVV